MEKLKYAVWTPQVKEKQNCVYWHKYLHLHLYKVKKNADNPVPTSVAHAAALQHILSYMNANKRQWDGSLVLRVWCQKVPNCFVSLWAEESEVFPKVSVHSTRLQLWGHCSCTLYAPISSFTWKSKQRIHTLIVHVKLYWTLLLMQQHEERNVWDCSVMSRRGKKGRVWTRHAHTHFHMNMLIHNGLKNWRVQ